MADPGSAEPASGAPARPEDDWDGHWESLSEASERNPAVAYRARLLCKLLDEAGGPRRLLDVGVGSGDFAALAAERWPTAELAGVDISAAGVAIAARRVPKARMLVEDLTVSGEAPEGLGGWATHAVCSEVLEHVDEPVVLLERARQMMAPGCAVVVTVPSGEMSAFDRHIGHRRHYTGELLTEQLEAGGYHVEEIMHSGFPFFNLYRRIVRARGDALIEDVATDAEPSAAAKAAMAVFDGLFRLNVTRSRWGGQLAAIARVPR